MDPRIQQVLSPKQQMQLCFSLQQALTLLQMPTLELSSWLEEKIDQNPLMQRKEHSFKNRTASQPTFFQELQVPYTISLFEHLMNQARLVFSLPQDLQIAEWIIGNLDHRGFFIEPLHLLPPHLDPSKVPSILIEIQQFSPCGIGATSLQESLLLQLRSQGKENSLGYHLVLHHMEQLLQGLFQSIKQQCKLEEEELQTAIRQDIAPLDPFPGSRFQKNDLPPLVPDLFIRENQGTWHIKVNEQDLPRYRINSPIQALLSVEEKCFFKRYLAEATWIQTALAKRKQTLYQIAKYVTKKQKNYLLKKESALSPLSFKEVAEELQLHESTITRAVFEKYIDCPLGIIPLKGLFSHALSDHVSSDQAQKLLKKLIEMEDKKAPLSDQALWQQMQQLGVSCARRTITKYRKILRIPSGRCRKVF